MSTKYVPLHSVHVAVTCTTQKLLKLATPNMNILFQTGFGNLNIGPQIIQTLHCYSSQYEYSEEG